MINPNRLDRFHRYFMVLAVASLILSIAYGIARFPTEERLGWQFVREIIEKQHPELSTEEVDRGLAMAKESYAGSFKSLAEERTRSHERQLREYDDLVRDNRGDADLHRFYLELRENAWKADIEWENELGRVLEDINSLAELRLKFVFNVFVLSWAFPLGVAYTVVRGLRWAHHGRVAAAGSPPPSSVRAGEDPSATAPTTKGTSQLPVSNAGALTPTTKLVRQFLFLTLFDGGGRSGRLAFLGAVLLGGVLSFLLLLLLALILSRSPGIDSGVLQGLGFVVFSLSVLAPATRRLHDMNAKGVYAALLIVPGLGTLFLIALMLIPGNLGPNQYGDSASRKSNSHASDPG